MDAVYDLDITDSVKESLFILGGETLQLVISRSRIWWNERESLEK